MKNLVDKLMSLMTRGKPGVHFVVVSGPRTGSNLLISLLGGHSKVRAGYELFNYAGEAEKKIHEILSDPYRYMTDFFAESRKQKKYVSGFKLIYGQGVIDHVREFLTSGFEGYPPASRERYLKKAEFIRRNIDMGELENSFRKVWEFILDRDSTRIIHLKRDNLLEVLYSYKIAIFTDSWSSKYPGSIAPPDKIDLDYEECLEYFRAKQAEMNDFDERLKSQEVLEVTYEDLMLKDEETMRAVFGFLGVRPEKTRPEFEKQNTKLLHEAIGNYYELKELFRGSEWERFFISRENEPGSGRW